MSQPWLKGFTTLVEGRDKKIELENNIVVFFFNLLKMRSGKTANSKSEFNGSDSKVNVSKGYTS